MATLFIIAFYILAGLAALGLLAIMVLYTMAEHEVRGKKHTGRSGKQALPVQERAYEVGSSLQC